MFSHSNLVPVWVGAGQGLVAPVDGVGPVVQAVVVGGGRAGWRHHRLQAVALRLGQRLQPGEQHLGAPVWRHFRHLGELASVQVLGATGIILQRELCIQGLVLFSPVIVLNSSVLK